MKRAAFLLLVFVLISGCIIDSQEEYICPEADFKYIGLSLVNEEILFINESRFSDKYLWDFGDGYTSESKNPIHIYSDDGYYKVTLTAIRNEAQSVYSIQLRIANNAIKWIEN